MATRSYATPRTVRFLGREFIRYAPDHACDVVSGLHFHRERSRGGQRFGRDRRQMTWHDSARAVEIGEPTTLAVVAERLNRRDSRTAREMVSE